MAAGLIVATVIAWRTFLLFSMHASHAYLYNAFDTRCDALAIGCFVALAADRTWFVWVESAVRVSPLLPLMTLFALFSSAYFGSSNYHYSIGMTVDALLLALLVVQLVGLSSTVLWKWLDHPLTRWLGLISYPTYLYHEWGLSVGQKMLPNGSVIPKFAAGYAATLFLAWLSYTFVEQRFLKMKDRLAPPLAADERGILPTAAVG